VGHWTLDNAENNATFMKALETLLRARDITFDSADNRISCFPHVINICATHTIRSFTNPDLADDQAEYHAASFPGDGEQNYREAVERNPIALCRSTVRAVRASGLRRDHLHEIICMGNAKEWFKLPVVQLLHDVKTRWDSMFLMIYRFQILRPVSDVMHLRVCSHRERVGY
jgi:hypothetical protein